MVETPVRDGLGGSHREPAEPVRGIFECLASSGEMVLGITSVAGLIGSLIVTDTVVVRD